jgi:hypothetical protein
MDESITPLRRSHGSDASVTASTVSKSIGNSILQMNHRAELEGLDNGVRLQAGQPRVAFLPINPKPARPSPL